MTLLLPPPAKDGVEAEQTSDAQYVLALLEKQSALGDLHQRLRDKDALKRACDVISTQIIPKLNAVNNKEAVDKEKAAINAVLIAKGTPSAQTLVRHLSHQSWPLFDRYSSLLKRQR